MTEKKDYKFPVQVKILFVFIIVCWIMAFYDSATSKTHSYCKSGHYMGKMYLCDTTVTVNEKGKIIRIDIR